MPLYDYGCSNCGWEGEKAASMDVRNNQSCPSCGATPLTIEFKPQPRYVPFPHYFDIGIGADITSYAQRRRLMKENGLDHRDPPCRGEISARKDKAMERRKERARRGHLDRKQTSSV